MNVIELSAAVVDRCVGTQQRLRSAIEQVVPETMGNGRAVIRELLNASGQVIEVPVQIRQRARVASMFDDAEVATHRARRAYLQLAGRGEATMTTTWSRPQLTRALDGFHDASTRLDQRIQDAADGFHDDSEELLGWVDVSLSAARRWAMWPTPGRARRLLHTVSHRPTPSSLAPGASSPR